MFGWLEVGQDCEHERMCLNRTSHPVWAPKYWKWLDSIDIRRRVEPLFQLVVEDFVLEIEELEVAKDHVNVSLNFSSRYKIVKVVGILEEYFGEAGVQRVSGTEAVVVERGVLG